MMEIKQDSGFLVFIMDGKEIYDIEIDQLQDPKLIAKWMKQLSEKSWMRGYMHVFQSHVEAINSQDAA